MKYFAVSSLVLIFLTIQVQAANNFTRQVNRTPPSDHDEYSDYRGKLPPQPPLTRPTRPTEYYTGGGIYGERRDVQQNDPPQNTNQVHRR